MSSLCASASSTGNGTRRSTPGAPRRSASRCLIARAIRLRFSGTAFVTKVRQPGGCRLVACEHAFVRHGDLSNIPIGRLEADIASLAADLARRLERWLAL